MNSEARSGRFSVGIISAGRVGSALGCALRAAGHTIVGAYASSEENLDRLDAMLPGVPQASIEEIMRAADVVMFAVPDDQLEPLVEGLAKLGLFRPGQLIFHVAGRFGAGVLSPAAQAGALTMAIHPAMTFTGTSLDVARLVGCPFAITSSALLRPIAEAIVTEMGGMAVYVEEEDRGLYHASLAHAANHLVTLISQSMRMMESMGVKDPGAYLTPLVEAALDGALRRGEAALTGPVARGDAGTVRDHLEAIDALAATAEDFSDIPSAYRALACATAQRVQAKKVVGNPDMQKILDLLQKN